MSYNENLISDQIDGGLRLEQELLDHFAGLAMQAFLNKDDITTFEIISANAYSIAYAMLKARKENK